MSQRSFEIQRDHAELLIGVTRLLTRGGTVRAGDSLEVVAR